MKAKEKQLLEYLKKHCPGRENAISGKQMKKRFRIHEAELRKLVHNLRVDGAPICSDRTGYFYPANAWEVIATIGHLRRMRDGVEKAIRSLERATGAFRLPGEVRRIAKPFFPWVGGKLFLLPYIFQLLPRRAPRLLEVCGGSGAVTLGLGAGYAPLRVYNDIDTDLANLFRCARDRPLALLRELDFLPLHARADFEVVFRFLNHEYDPMDYLEEELQIAEDYFPPMDRQEVKKLLVGRANLPDVQRAAAYYLSIRYSYSATGNSFGGRSVELRRFLGLLRRASDTLQGVVVENKDCCDVVRQYARPGAVIYADPPYLEAERMYAPSFDLRDHVRLHDCLCAPAARDSHIVLSYNSHPDILDLFAPDFYIVGFDRPNPMARQEDSRYHELLMTNFDPSPMLNRQLSLLDNPGLVSSDRPELRILSAPTGRLPRVWDWPQD